MDAHALLELAIRGSRVYGVDQRVNCFVRSDPEKGGAKGAVMLGDEMIDEASRKMALVISAKGRAAGMQRTDVWSPPDAG